MGHNLSTQGHIPKAVDLNVSYAWIDKHKVVVGSALNLDAMEQVMWIKTWIETNQKWQVVIMLDEVIHKVWTVCSRTRSKGCEWNALFA